MMKKIYLLSFLLLFTVAVKAQKAIKEDRPKLVVGVIVDQMRYDYLLRFNNKFGDGGFKRLMNNGFNCENARYNYIPTYTAVGHSSIYTGALPDTHGIIGNNWYDKYLKKEIYCVDDFSYKAVGTNKENEQKSPYRLLTTTITDELRLAQNMHNKTISISIKDRGAVLPGGHTANAAYWFIGKNEGKFVTSSFYIDKLPKWVDKFNGRKLPKEYVNQKWETLYPIETYSESIADNNIFEGVYKGEKTPTFPHNLPKLRKLNSNYDLVKNTPFGNSIVTEFTKAAIIGEKLGQSNYTDFLTVSYSSTDYIGHQFGVDSKEIQDTYLRIDKEIEDLLQFLDEKVGANNYTLFLTADHAAVPVPSYLKSKKIPAAYVSNDDFKDFVFNLTEKKFGTANIVEHVDFSQIYLKKDVIDSLNVNYNTVIQFLMDKIIDYKGVHKVVSAQTLQNTNFTEGILYKLQNGYNQKLSGDILIVPNPATITYPETGSTHGSGFSYDTHVPIIFYGKGVKKGNSKKYIPIIDIVPTMANLLQIETPNGAVGNIVVEALK